MKTIVKADSHELSAFIACPKRYMWSYLAQIEPQKKRKAFAKGNFVAKMLQIYYYRKMKGKDNKRLYAWVFTNTEKYCAEDPIEVRDILLSYFSYYKDCKWKILAVEAGFSFKLHEDDKYIFIYEGRPDLVVQDEGKRIFPVDHKTQSRKYDIYPFNNQAIGYCVATEATEFVYNYLKFTEEEKFRRIPYKISDGVKRVWKEEAIAWFYKLAEAREKLQFNRSYNCETKFGLCDFTTLCEQTTEAATLWYLDSKYKKRKRWRAW